MVKETKQKSLFERIKDALLPTKDSKESAVSSFTTEKDKNDKQEAVQTNNTNAQETNPPVEKKPPEPQIFSKTNKDNKETEYDTGPILDIVKSQHEGDPKLKTETKKPTP